MTNGEKARRSFAHAAAIGFDPREVIAGARVRHDPGM
jgi:hypothetical protein